MSPDNTNSPPTFTPYPHNESTSTSALLHEEQSISHCRTFVHPFSREHQNDDTEPEQTFLSLSSLSRRTFSHQLFSCPQPIYEARSLRQHGTMERRRWTTQGGAWPLSAPPMNHIRVPSASIGPSHGSNITNPVPFNNPTFATMNTFPNFGVQEQEQDVFRGTTRVINDVQQLQPFIPCKRHSSVEAMDVEYGFDANMTFNNRQFLNPMPLRNTSKRESIKAYSTVKGQLQIQANSVSGTEVKRHSTYSPSVSPDGTRWHCNHDRCDYTTEREQDMIRHCSTVKHGRRQFFPCPSCGKRFSRKDSVTRHSKKTSCGLWLRAPLLGSSA